MNARRFDTDERFLAYLAAVNPDHAYRPTGWDYAAAMQEAESLYQHFQIEFGSGVYLDKNVQSASYHAGISLPSGIGIQPPGCEIRLSNFAHLAVITWEEGVSMQILVRIVELIEQGGYTYVPFRLFGEPFGTRQRCNGDLFNQFFDYG